MFNAEMIDGIGEHRMGTDIVWMELAARTEWRGEGGKAWRVRMGTGCWQENDVLGDVPVHEDVAWPRSGNDRLGNSRVCAPDPKNLQVIASVATPKPAVARAPSASVPWRTRRKSQAQPVRRPRPTGRWRTEAGREEGRKPWA